MFLAGHSLGGLVTASSLLANQSNVTGTILIAPALKYQYSRLVRWIANVGGIVSPTRTIPLRNGPIEMLTRDPVEQAKLLSDPLLDIRGVTWATAKGTLAISRENWAHYHQIHRPVLAVHGTYDTITNARGSVEFINTVRSTDKTLYMPEGGRHDLLTDLVSDEVRDTIVQWITERM